MLPMLDAHTHLDALHPCARGLHDILLYHMVVSDLVSAGCPDRERLPESPSDEEARSRIERALPYFPAISNTSCFWGLRIILEDLYGWRKPITAASWRALDALIRERGKDKAWAREIQSRAGIARSCTELWRRHDGRADAMFQYSLEWAFFGRAKRGEHDTALWELEKAWSEGSPGAPSPIGVDGARPVPARTIHSIDDVHEALDAYVDAIPGNVLSTAQHLSTDIDFQPVDDEIWPRPCAAEGGREGPSATSTPRTSWKSSSRGWRRARPRWSFSSRWAPSPCRTRPRAGWRSTPLRRLRR